MPEKRLKRTRDAYTQDIVVQLHESTTCPDVHELCARAMQEIQQLRAEAVEMQNKIQDLRYELHDAYDRYDNLLGLDDR